jgi:hypothetical protein
MRKLLPSFFVHDLTIASPTLGILGCAFAGQFNL